MVLAYAREGADVAIVARTPSELDAVASEVRALGRRAHTVNAELTTSEGANRAARETISELGKIDILVNNAGGYRLFTKDLTHSVSVLDITEEEWRLVTESNLTTAFMACKAVLPHMMERRSSVVVNLTSKNVARGAGPAGSYGASKAAVERLSESLADEVTNFGIAVNILDPGWNRTKPNDEAHKRMRLPDDIAEVAVYMAQQTPETITGQLVSAPEYDEEHGIERLSAYERLHASLPSGDPYHGRPSFRTLLVVQVDGGDDPSGTSPTTRVVCPRPVRSSARLTSPGPSLCTVPSPRPISASPERVIRYCLRGATCQSLKNPGGKALKTIPLALCNSDQAGWEDGSTTSMCDSPSSPEYNLIDAMTPPAFLVIGDGILTQIGSYCLMLTHKTGQAAERESHFYSVNYFCGSVCLQGTRQDHIVVSAETVVIVRRVRNVCREAPRKTLR